MAIDFITERDFESKVLRSEIPVLIDLYADWCEPCKRLEPILKELSVELEGKLKVARVDIERSPLLARGFQVRSIPMLLLLSGGRLVNQIVGLADKQAILKMVQPVLPTAADEIEPKQLAELLVSRRVLPVDIRDATAYARYRIPGAINLPAADIMNQIKKLKSTNGRLPVLYARSTDEAKDWVAKLRESGIHAAFLKGGFLHWEADGLEVERG
jgi:thioredoxin 1